MGIFQIVIIIFSCLFIWLIIKFVTKVLLKIVFLFLILVVSFFAYFHFSKTNIFDKMNELYCVQNKSVENLKCKCFVLNITEDFEKNNKNEVEQIKKNTLKSMNEFLESYDNKKEDIRDCFEKNGASGNLVEEIKNDLIEKTTSFFKSKK